MPKPVTLSPGDIVRFPQGKVDWEVAEAKPDRQFNFQRLVLRSGMTDRVVFTTNLRVERTQTAEEVAQRVHTRALA